MCRIANFLSQPRKKTFPGLKRGPRSIEHVPKREANFAVINFLELFSTVPGLALKFSLFPYRYRWHVGGQCLEVVQRRRVAVQDEVDDQVEGSQDSAEATAKATQKDVLLGEAPAIVVVSGQPRGRRGSRRGRRGLASRACRGKRERWR